MNGIANMIKHAVVNSDIIKATRKRTRILGTSRKKLLRSTSFFVAPHSAKRVSLGEDPSLREGLTNVVTEHVGEKSFAQMDRETTKEYHA